MAFKKATRQNATIKMAITGTSGSGKTYSALLIAKGLGGKTALLDTEYGSASLYADKFEFDTWDELDPRGFPPEYFINVIKAAEEAGYKNLIIDSLTHEWSGRGGCLELADAIAKAKYSGNSWSAWSEVTPRHNKLIEAIIGANINIIVTMRTKTEYVLVEDAKGKKRPQKVGMGSVQRDGMDYEFTLMFELDRDSHIAAVGKDRTGLFVDPRIISEDTGKTIAQWLSGSINGGKPYTKFDGQPNPAMLEVLSHHSDDAKQALNKALNGEQPKPEPKKEKKDPTPYIQDDMDKRMANGEDANAILKSYADILQTDNVKTISDMTNEERVIVARELYKRNSKKVA